MHYKKDGMNVKNSWHALKILVLFFDRSLRMGGDFVSRLEIKTNRLEM